MMMMFTCIDYREGVTKTVLCMHLCQNIVIENSHETITVNTFVIF